jgi:hypothetical protein
MTKKIKKVLAKNTPKIKPRKINDNSSENVTFFNYSGRAKDSLFTLKPDNIFAGLIAPLSAKEFDSSFF